MLLDAFRRNEKLVWWILLPVLGIFGIWGPGSIAALFSGFDAAVVLDRPIHSDDMYEESRRCFSGPQDGGGKAALDPLALSMSLNRLIYLKALEPSGLGAGDAQAEAALDRTRTRTLNLPSETWSLFGPALPRPYQGTPNAEAAWRTGQSFGGYFQMRLAAWQSNRLSRRDFESLREVAREELILRRHRRLLEDTAKTTLASLYAAYTQDQARLKVRYALLDIKACEARVPASELTDEAVTKWFGDRKDRPAAMGGYQIPERITLATLTLREEKLNAQFPVDPAEVESFYQNHKDRFINEGKHEVLKTLEQARPEIIHELNRERVQDRMDTLVASILDGPEDEPFATTAERLGIEAGTATVDADFPKIEGLGFLPDLHESLEGLEPGARINHPFPCGEKGRDDRCVLRLLSRQPAHAPDLAEVRQKVLADLRTRKAQEMAQQTLLRLKEAAAADKDGGLEKAVASLLPTTPGLTTGIVPELRHPDQAPLPKPLEHQADLAKALFALEKPAVLSEPGGSEDGSEGGILQILERLPADAAGFQAQRAALTKKAHENLGYQFLDGWLDSVSRRTGLGKRLATVFRQGGAEAP